MKNWNTHFTSIQSIRGYHFSFVFKGLLLFFILLSFTASGQERAQLESQREKILEEIRYTERLLSKTKKDAKTTSADLSAIRHKINLREQLVNSLKREVNALNREVFQNETVINDLNNQLEKLKENYSQSVYRSYKYQKTNQQLLFILGAESINQAVRRLNYMRKINQRRKEQAGEIKSTTDQVRAKLAGLEVMKKDKQALLAENTLQMRSLESEKSTKDKYIARLKNDEKKFKDEIKRKNDESKKLDKEIRLIIQRELAAKENKSNFGSTPEVLIQLSKDFYSNKGKLPWPVEKGYVARYFGKHNHPELKNITVDNNGIDIRTGKNSPVRAVFNGEVVSVLTNPIFKHAVIVKHGEYFTVYTKLGSVKVKKGDQLGTKDLIGYAYTDNDVAEVHLEVWKGKTNLDPYTWIHKK